MVAEQLQESLNLIRDVTVADASQLHAKFLEKRQRLNLHVAAMHSPRLAAGLSLYQMYGQLLRLPRSAESGVRLPRPAVQTIKRADVEAGCELLRETASHADLVTGTSTSGGERSLPVKRRHVRRSRVRAVWLRRAGRSPKARLAPLSRRRASTPREPSETYAGLSIF